MTHNVEEVREVIVENPSDHVASLTHFSTMLFSTTIFVIDTEKLESSFSTTNALATVMLNNCDSSLPVPISKISSVIIWILLEILPPFGCILFPTILAHSIFAKRRLSTFATSVEVEESWKIFQIIQIYSSHTKYH